MARKLKTFETSLGFFDLAIAAPSMKAALEAWGADSNLFHQRAARESKNSGIIAATLAKPGVVLKRPVGSDQPFSEHAELPTQLEVEHHARSAKASPRSRTSQRSLRAAPVIPRLSAGLHWPMRRSSGAGKPSAGRRRRNGRRSASGASRPLPRPRPRWTTPNGSMTKGQRRSMPRAQRLKKSRRPRRRVGRRRKTSSALHSAGSAASALFSVVLHSPPDLIPRSIG